MQMLSNNNVARPNKISRDVSNFIITQVLERSDDLIKNSYRRLTTENVARNGHWAEIAVKVSKHFDIPAEMERVKSHFHNRKKVLLARIKDELKNVPNSQFMSTEEKLEELTKRKICVGEYDEQLAKVCLDIEEEERGRTEQYGIPIMETMFTETSTQSLLSQLLSTPNNSHYDHRSPPFAGSKESESAALVPNLAPAPPIIANRSPAAPLLAKLLTDPSTSKGNDFVRSSRAPSGVPERKRRVVSPMECHRSPILPNPNSHYLSHLIVDVTSPQELKRLLSVLIDHGFTRFQHVAASDFNTSSAGNHAISSRHVETTRQIHEPLIDDLYERDNDTPFWATASVPSNEEVAAIAENEIDVVKAIKSRVERVEVKVEPCSNEDDVEYQDEEIDEHTAELEAELALEAARQGHALFEKPPSPKKVKLEKTGSAASSCNGDGVTAHCELCGSGIRLNAGGSKWNLYEHVMMKHSAHKPFKCSQCPYQAGRKERVRQHGVSQHGVDTDPIDVATPEIRSEWLEMMSKCFPQHQYGKMNGAAVIKV